MPSRLLVSSVVFLFVRLLIIWRSVSEDDRWDMFDEDDMVAPLDALQLAECFIPDSESLSKWSTLAGAFIVCSCNAIKFFPAHFRTSFLDISAPC